MKRQLALMTTPPPTCDTVNMKYVTDIVPILQNSCYTCHGNGNSSGAGIVLDNYANLKAYADSGLLKGAITHTAGYPAMPYLKPKLDDCTINKMLDWINRNSPDN